MENVFAFASEPRSAIGHNSPSLSRSNLTAQVGLARFAKLALPAFWSAGRNKNRQSTDMPAALSRGILESYNMISWFD
jgi:hypothetical protein